MDDDLKDALAYIVDEAEWADCEGKWKIRNGEALFSSSDWSVAVDLPVNGLCALQASFGPHSAEVCGIPTRDLKDAWDAASGFLFRIGRAY